MFGYPGPGVGCQEDGEAAGSEELSAVPGPAWLIRVSGFVKGLGFIKGEGFMGFWGFIRVPG